MSGYTTRQRSVEHKKIVLGITGSYGTGKTTVAKIFRSFGAKVIDADKIAHSLIKPATTAYNKIIAIFGSRILKKDKRIDRAKLSKIVFNNPKLLERLNKIVHPAVIRIIKNELSRASRKVVVLDVPLFFEAGLGGLVDKIIVVKLSRQKQLKRLLKKTSLSRQDILKRINAQMPLSDKIRVADFIIDNSGTIEKTRRQVEKVRRILWKN